MRFYPIILIILCNKTMNNVFTSIYENSSWGSNQHTDYNGSSGPGSALHFNKDTYIPFLKKFIIDNEIKQVTDLGCGDFRCGFFIYDDLDIKYSGYDTYKKVIDYNSTQYSLPKYKFTHLDFLNNKEDIADGELCIIKDVLQHWSLNNIYTFLDYLIDTEKFKTIMIVNCSQQIQDNPDINDGEWRPLSCNFLPLSKYGGKTLFKWDTKELSVITI